MDLFLKKLLFISKLNNFKNNNSTNCELLVNKVNSIYKVNEKTSNFVKISVECNAFDVNEDKQRQCYKQLKCFWPKCQFSANYESDLNRHISYHLNERQFVCEECNKQFHTNSTLLQHKYYFHRNDRSFICQRIDCNKRFKTKRELIRHNISHTSDQNFKCDKCDKRFKFKRNLIRHNKTHSSEKHL